MNLDKLRKTALLLLIMGTVTVTAVLGSVPHFPAFIACTSNAQDDATRQGLLPATRNFTIRGKVVDAVTKKTLDFSELRIYKLLGSGKPSPYDNGIELLADRKRLGSFVGKDLRPGKYVIRKSTWQVKKLAAYRDCEEFFSITDASLSLLVIKLRKTPTRRM